MSELKNIRIIEAGRTFNKKANHFMIAAIDIVDYRMEMSSKGGLRITMNNDYKVWISKKHFDSYQITNIGRRPVMVFTSDFDIKKCLDVFRDYHIEQTKSSIEALEKSLLFWQLGHSPKIDFRQ